ncbi:hypothetical protein QYM36_008448 [Artemia franciscana]|uniref:Uncharacterized protein n=1 Tax=Artemia franciscana TaxID=6661 RepID=A0AA88III8_ARTSF|nr:hypothetical protein QYM36_008448 [Artemia franciscana]
MDVPEFTIIESNLMKKYVKVQVGSRETKHAILKNSRKLRWETVMNQSGVSLEDNAPLSVHETRKKLASAHEKICSCGIQGLETWVTKSIPPIISVKR